MGDLYVPAVHLPGSMIWILSLFWLPKKSTTPPATETKVDFQEYVRWSQGASWSEQLLVRDDRDREARRLARVYGIHLLVTWIGSSGVVKGVV